MFDIFYINNKPKILNAVNAVSFDDAREKSRTRYLWMIDGCNDYSNFDFTQEPVPWESDQTHIWPSQWQENGGTHLISKGTKEATNYRKEIITRSKNAASIIFLDFGNKDASASFKQINEISTDVIKTRFISSYHGTLSRIIDKIDSEYAWITSSVCDYSDFDFTWHPSEWHKETFHVFPSNEQRFGDTFYIHVPTFKEQVNKIELLEWYKTIHFIKEISIPRWPIPVVRVSDDSLVDAVKHYTFGDPVVLFTNNISKEYELPTTNLWREKTRTVVPLSNGTNTVLVPRDAKNHIDVQVYDYPYISKKYIRHSDNPLDIVYISNGESNADQNWNHLLKVTNGLLNKVKRIDGVNGRSKAYQQAAKLSDTAWFFAVFAKLKANKDFNWNWQPDRLQQSKHYIFHAKNPITGLEYGHMAMIAYNKELVLNNDAHGLDFTLDQEHEVVPILSGTAYYADNIGTAWRSAFREVIKLKDSNTIDNEYRLQKWLDSNGTELGIWSQRGAEDAVEYYNNVSGEFSKLRLSYEWDWLNEYFIRKYGTKHDL
jgi:hypothetical protein